MCWGDTGRAPTALKHDRPGRDHRLLVSLLSTWSFLDINWPASTDSALNVNVDNQGNVNGQATLSMTPADGGGDSKFSMLSPPNTVAPTASSVEAQVAMPTLVRSPFDAVQPQSGE